MDYDQALRELGSRIPTRMVPDLSRITALAGLMGDPQRSYPSIHVSGTNGKTSVARMVTALLSALGIQAGTYTSPHLQSIRERLSVAGRRIERDEFAELYAGIASLADLVDERQGPGEERVTYFELLTAMAYWWFADYPVEVGVFEVGMGGSWDATNLVRGEVAVLTAVDVDHPELGSTPAEVAVEKAGIIKPGAVVVCAAQRPDVLDVVRGACEQQGAHLLLPGRELELEDRRLAVGGQLLRLRAGNRRYTEVFLPLHGGHQADNALLALGALHAFLGNLQKVDVEIVRSAFAAVEVPGRLEVVSREPTVLLDGAHNPAGARRSAEAVAGEFPFRDLILVVACLADKDIHGILSAFRDLAGHVVVTAAPSARSAPAQDMERLAREVWSGTTVAVEGAATVAEALDKATGVAGERDGVLVTGSLYTVGAARDLYAPGEG